MLAFLTGGNGTCDSVANEQKLKTYNPVRRDATDQYRYTAVTKAGVNAGWRGWRLRVEDAGVWMIHCHILQHMAMGIQSVWVTVRSLESPGRMLLGTCNMVTVHTAMRLLLLHTCTSSDRRSDQ